MSESVDEVAKQEAVEKVKIECFDKNEGGQKERERNAAAAVKISEMVQ